MKATFELDPCHELEVKAVGVRDVSDPGVLVTLTRKPVFSGSSIGGGVTDESQAAWSRGMHFAPSFARAIASALLSAATEAKAT